MDWNYYRQTKDKYYPVLKQMYIKLLDEHRLNDKIITLGLHFSNSKDKEVISEIVKSHYWWVSSDFDDYVFNKKTYYRVYMKLDFKEQLNDNKTT